MAKSTIGISTMKSGKIIFADTGALFAAANTKDKDHQRAKDFLTKLAEEEVILLVTNFIIAEIYTLMLRTIGRDEAIAYVEKLRNTAEMERVSE